MVSPDFPMWNIKAPRRTFQGPMGSAQVLYLQKEQEPKGLVHPETLLERGKTCEEAQRRKEGTWGGGEVQILRCGRNLALACKTFRRPVGPELGLCWVEEAHAGLGRQDAGGRRALLTWFSVWVLFPS